ncbi:MAG: hypothetical protein GW859_06050 [Sphingomonadales bacterium]|nr:hypothetical protein [Sphingomonadales bacterium]
MKIDWKSELTATAAAVALTGVAVWGSILPIHTGPAMSRQPSSIIAIAALDAGLADRLREGSNA